MPDPHPSPPTGPAFEAVYETYRTWVVSFFRRKGFPDALATEFTQDVFLSVYAHEMHQEPQERLVPWLITVVQNKAVSEHRKKVAHARLGPAGRQVSRDWTRPAEDPEASTATVEEVRALTAQVRQMPEMMRRCLLLRYGHDLNQEEMADYLGLSVNTVKTHLKRALKFLRLRLADARGSGDTQA